MGAPGQVAMILAAGLGTRMRPLTDATPKPLIRVAGQSLIDRTVDCIRAAGIRRVIVNMHYLAGQIEGWASTQTDIQIVLSDERDQLLDTGGGVARALPYLGAAPFFVFNSDSFWIEGDVPALERLRGVWDETRMDCVLLLSNPERSVGFEGAGDFFVDQAGRLKRNTDKLAGAHVYCGCYLVSPRLFDEAPDCAFSMNVLWNKALAAGRLFGLVHDGLWLHVGTPDAIKLAEDAVNQAR